jgi:hypothetical protein
MPVIYISNISFLFSSVRNSICRDDVRGSGVKLPVVVTTRVVSSVGGISVWAFRLRAMMRMYAAACGG